MARRQAGQVSVGSDGSEVNGSHRLRWVGAGTRFDKGVMLKRPDEVHEVAT